MFTYNCFIFLVIFHRSKHHVTHLTVFCRSQKSKAINLIWVQRRFNITLMVLMDDLPMERGQISILILLLHELSALLTMRACSHLTSPQSHIPINKELNNQKELFWEFPTVLGPPLEGETQQTQVKNYFHCLLLTEETKKAEQ